MNESSESISQNYEEGVRRHGANGAGGEFQSYLSIITKFSIDAHILPKFLGISRNYTWVHFHTQTITKNFTIHRLLPRATRREDTEAKLLRAQLEHSNDSHQCPILAADLLWDRK